MGAFLQPLLGFSFSDSEKEIMVWDKVPLMPLKSRENNFISL